MPTQAKAAYGTKIKMGDGGSPETFTEIPEIGDITGPGMEVETEDVTTHSSAGSGANREFLATMITNTDCEFEMNYVAADPMHVALINAAKNRTIKNFQKINPLATQTTSFTGYVVGITFADPVDGAQKCSVTIKPTAGLTFS